MRRPVAALASAMVLAMLLPGAVAADRLTRYQDHTVELYCESGIDGGYAFVSAFSSDLDGFASADVSVWFDPAVPWEDPADISGSAPSFDAVAGDVLTISADVPVVGPDGSDLGTATLAAQLAANGPSYAYGEPGFGNHKSRTETTERDYSGTATMSLGATSIQIADCHGAVRDISAWQTNPHATALSDEGLDLSCAWEVADGSASMFIQASTTGRYVDVYVESPDATIGSTGEVTGTADASGLDLSIGMADLDTRDPSTATAVAAFTPDGAAVTSMLRAQDSLEKLEQQLLSASGTLTLGDGRTFPIDDASCRTVWFDRHFVSSQPAGPRDPAAAPVNDTPDGAIALAPGARLVTSNRGAAIDPEQPISTCPEGPFDDFGRTLWYAIEGTGGQITVDTDGSLIDTVAAAFVRDGDTLVEIACNDDVERVPLGSSYQAAITFDTVEGATYLVEVGGYRPFFDPENVETGQIRIAVR